MPCLMELLEKIDREYRSVSRAWNRKRNSREAAAWRSVYQAVKGNRGWELWQVQYLAQFQTPLRMLRDQFAGREFCLAKALRELVWGGADLSPYRLED